MVEKSVKCEHKQNLALHIGNARFRVVMESLTLMLGDVLSIQWIINDIGREKIVVARGCRDFINGYVQTTYDSSSTCPCVFV